MDVETSVLVRAPATVVRHVFTDYTGWPTLFPTITGVQLRERHGATILLEVDHVEGLVTNELTVDATGQVVLREVKRRYDAVFVNRFDSVPAGTLFTVRANLTFKGIARLLRPVLSGYVRRQVKRLTLLPVKAMAESRTP